MAREWCSNTASSASARRRENRSAASPPSCRTTGWASVTGIGSSRSPDVGKYPRYTGVPLTLTNCPQRPASASARNVDASVHRQHDVEVPRTERVVDGLAEVRIAVDVLDVGEIRRFVRSPMEDGDVVVTRHEPVDDMGAGRPRPPDHQDSHARRRYQYAARATRARERSPGPSAVRCWIASGQGANVVVGGRVVVGAPSSSFGTKSTSTFFTRTFVLSVGPAYL